MRHIPSGIRKMSASITRVPSWERRLSYFQSRRLVLLKCEIKPGRPHLISIPDTMLRYMCHLPSSPNTISGAHKVAESFPPHSLGRSLKLAVPTYFQFAPSLDSAMPIGVPNTQLTPGKLV